MSTALNRQRKSEYDSTIQTQYEPKYQEFNQISPQQLELEDVIFFARVSVFAISTVLICFILLAQKVSAFWSFGLALLLSLAVVTGVSYLLQYLLKD